MYFNIGYIQQSLFKEQDLLICRYPVRINGNEVPKGAFAVVININITGRMQDILVQDSKNRLSNSTFNAETSDERVEKRLRSAYKNEVKRFVKHKFAWDTIW